MGKIVIVPTPLGNLEDITLRALRVLKESDLILAEDTRKSGILLKHYGISVKVTAYHQHNEHTRTAALLDQMGEDDVYALVTDAGTPGISDPGFMLVREAIGRGIEVECLPGAVAFIPALVGSGLPCDRFHFEGFLPHKKGRMTRIAALADYPFTVVFYESPHRLVKTLQQLGEGFGPDRQAVVARELTKIHEEFTRGTLQDLAYDYGSREVKGEIVIIVAGKA
ncbi:MAG: 16S rRNA (cytidine(1402)-2'-O)-methyltransferase [Bacteroidales bacterium]